jgi:cupin fold WbuC family metalloprotein
MSASGMTLLGQELLDSLARQAACSPRLRVTYLLHTPTERVQRCLIALQPGTYVRPHRHPPMPGRRRFEFLLVVQGAIGILLFDEHGTIVETVHLGQAQSLYGAELAEATYHTVVALAPNTIVLEIKEGPYEAGGDKAFLPLFPDDNTRAAQQLTAQWQHQVTQALSGLRGE